MVCSLLAGIRLVACDDVGAALVPMLAGVRHAIWKGAAAVCANPTALSSSGSHRPIIRQFVHETDLIFKCFACCCGYENSFHHAPPCLRAALPGSGGNGIQ
jgi:hypothetical protein